MIIRIWQRYINAHQFPYKIPEDSHFKACQGHMLAHQHLSLPSRHQLDIKKTPNYYQPNTMTKKDPKYLQKLPQKTCVHIVFHHPLDPSSLPCLPPKKKHEKKKTSRDTMKWSFQDPLDRITVLLIIASREAKSLQRVAAHGQGREIDGWWLNLSTRLKHMLKSNWGIIFPNLSPILRGEHSKKYATIQKFLDHKIGERIAVP